IPEEVFPPPSESLPSTAQDDPQTIRFARMHSPAATHLPKPPLQIPALLRTGRGARSRDPRQTVLYPIAKPALSSLHRAACALTAALLESLRAAFSESIAQSRTPRQIPTMSRSGSASSYP